jgi:hypothetical protein
MVRELTPPGMQDPEEPGQVPAEVARVPGEGLDGVRGGGEEGALRGALAAAQEGAQGFGHGEGEEEMVPGEGAGEPPGQPLVLALRAVAVPVGAERPVRFPALGARIADHPTGVGPTGHESLEDFPMGRRYPVAIGGEVRGAERPEELTELAHDRALP